MKGAIYSGYKHPLKPFESGRFLVYDLNLKADHWYSMGFVSALSMSPTTPLINVEHDMEISDDLCEELFACEYPFCTWAYTVYRPHVVDLNTGKVTQGPPVYEPHFAQCDWTMENGERREFKPVEQGTETCHYTGIGFCKITPNIYAGKMPVCHWTEVETHVNDMAIKSGNRWHIHWPAVNHWHR